MGHSFLLYLLCLQNAMFCLSGLGVQAAYWTMVEEQRVTQTAALILMQSVDEALDAAMKNEVLADWKGLDPHVKFPTYLKHLRLRSSRVVPKRVLNFLVIERLEFSCHISAAFLRAHRSARRQLREFIGKKTYMKSNDSIVAMRGF